MANKIKNLTREELLDGKIAGVHILSEPIVGFNKIECTCLINKDMEDVGITTELEIPAGSTVVRPFIEYLKKPSNELRSDSVIVKSIDTDSMALCTCNSIHDKFFKYEE
jgi:hypothetical protein